MIFKIFFSDIFLHVGDDPVDKHISVCDDDKLILSDAPRNSHESEFVAQRARSPDSSLHMDDAHRAHVQHIFSHRVYHTIFVFAEQVEIFEKSVQLLGVLGHHAHICAARLARKQTEYVVSDSPLHRGVLYTAYTQNIRAGAQVQRTQGPAAHNQKQLARTCSLLSHAFNHNHVVCQLHLLCRAGVRKERKQIRQHFDLVVLGDCDHNYTG